MIAFVGLCLLKDSSLRASVDDLLSHPWLASTVEEVLGTVTHKGIDLT